ncbi:MAG: 50S ribosomal protein L18 [Gemmatimonadota bacterium]|nr:50S ribosomal protein L18 [Gemmatimonadota bacterium]
MTKRAIEREENRRRRHKRVRKRMFGTPDKPRLVVHRSLKHIEAQLVDDFEGRTLLGVSSQALEVEGDKTDQARATGREVAERAKEEGITRVVFDRGGYRYHGRVKALAEGAREAGLEF